MTRLVIGVAPTGARKSKADHPALPITPREIAHAAAACREAGAALFHLHVRDPDGRHSLDSGAYREAIEVVRQAVGDDFVIQVTSESGGRYAADEQMAMVRAVHPEAVSLGLGEIIPHHGAEREAARFLSWLHAERILLQYILYAPDEITRYRDVCRRGILPGERHFLLYVLGRHAVDGESSPHELLPFVAAAEDATSPRQRDEASEWMVCAFGRRESECVVVAAALGGHVRVGFENNVYLPDGRWAADNAALVDRVRAAAALLGRPVADASAARDLLWRLME